VSPTHIVISASVIVNWTKATSSTASVGVAPIPNLSDTPVTLSATVAGFAPSGTVNFKNGDRIVTSATATNSSGATGSTMFQTTTVLGPGTYNLVAEYVGDANNLPSLSPTSPTFAVTLSPAHAAAIRLIIDSLLLDD
jgi:hypothetical protein